ncbi:hypothetical protein BDZ94DRAFT_1311869 [Collybia nuda]|uniref:AMP-dependent synthetase/ligase domain-containing protein n=1 Tax=Collybia nuda TaxID=64659 RepID=A0A9P5Y0D2_9AGAR|nr:hypothetical protein BDZ94DRAFT_1311869 [Collybia nuda]
MPTFDFDSFLQPPPGLPIQYAFDFQLEHNAHYPILVHPNGGGLKYYNYSEVVPAIHRAGLSISTSIGFPILQGGSSVPPVVAIVAETNNLTYLTVILGCLRAGITVLPISPRFSSSVIAHLLRTAKATHVLISESMYNVTWKAIEDIKETSSHTPPGIVYMLTYQDLYLPSESGVLSTAFLPPHHPEFGKTQPSMILHSSSSTSLFPKLIPWSEQFLTSISAIESAIPRFRGRTFGTQATEFFHGAGLYFIFWACRVGLILATMDPLNPQTSIPAEEDLIFRNFEETRPAYIWASPRFIEIWATDPHKVRFMKTVDGVIFGGRFLNKRIGDKLVDEGVSIFTVYGSTECSYVSTFISEPQGKDWEYFTLNPGVFTKLRHVETSDMGSIHELFVVSKPGLHELPVTVWNAKWDWDPAYQSSDLVIEHPTKTGHYKILGRKGDQIMMSSGEVVYPIPIEDDIRYMAKFVKSAIVFGYSRPCLGVIIELHTPSEALNTEQSDILCEVLEKINENLPLYARISIKMVITASSQKPFPYGNKGVPRRPVILRAYDTEIYEAYALNNNYTKGV